MTFSLIALSLLLGGLMTKVISGPEVTAKFEPFTPADLARVLRGHG
jgi:hypothetical protein